MKTGSADSASASFVSIDITAELSARSSAAPRLHEENQALIALATAIAQNPAGALRSLADTAMRLTSAHSAGVSVAELDDGKPVFRWRAVAGEFEPYLGQIMPGDFSPCANVIAAGTVMLLQHPARHYPYVASLHCEVVELLMAPFHRDGEPVGTVWVVSHDDTKRFDQEDARILRAVSAMASEANDLLERLAFGVKDTAASPS